MLQAGAGKSEIVLTDEILPLEHFTYRHDPLFSRVLIIEANQAFVFISLDLTSLQDYAITAIKERIIQIYNVSFDHIFIGVTHTFSAPHTRSLQTLKQASESIQEKNQTYLRILVEAVAQGVQKAKESIQPVCIEYQFVQEDCNVNRDIELREGYWLGQNPEAYSNNTVPIVKLLTDSGKILSIIYSIDVQSSIVNQLDRAAISGDLIGSISQKIERAYECIALFMLGAAADQAPRVSEFSEDALEELASKVASDMIVQLKNNGTRLKGVFYLKKLMITVKGQVMPDMRKLKPIRTYHFAPSIDREVEVSVLTCNELAMVMMKPEITSVIGDQIKEQSPYPITLVATMVNGGQKYMADAESYQNFTYEAMNSMFACGSAELVCQEISKALREGR